MAAVQIGPTTLITGFDSAWTATNRGAIAAALVAPGETPREILPRSVNYSEAIRLIDELQVSHRPHSTIVLIDQPTIVRNDTGQRPVENIVSSVVSLRYGGMQPANTTRSEMFGPTAPIWSFLQRFGGAANPWGNGNGSPTSVFETYPVLSIITAGWLLADSRRTGRLPKYNPERRHTFALRDWQFICECTVKALRKHNLHHTAEFVAAFRALERPSKEKQDMLDACLCLLAAYQLAQGVECLCVGDLKSGYIVVPNNPLVEAELQARCVATKRDPAYWVRSFRYPGPVEGVR